MNVKIGSIIKKLRNEQKVTQEQLATALGVTPQAVSRWESGVAIPDAANLLQLSRLFEVARKQISREAISMFLLTTPMVVSIHWSIRGKL